MNIKELIDKVVEKEASDLHLCVDLPPSMRLNGYLMKLGDRKLVNDDIEKMLDDLLPQTKRSLVGREDMDMMIEVGGLARFRVNVYKDFNGLSVALRYIPTKIKLLDELGLPAIVEQVCYLRKGLVLVTGGTGSGKSTTLASIIDKINSEREAHVITIEDPIEYVHRHKKCIINQRELGTHVNSFPQALRGALREDPDVILVGEVRDLETMAMMITAAETGHLVFATLHTRNAPQSVNRVIDVFSPHQQEQIRLQLADSLEMILSQALIPSVDHDRRYLACEILVVTPAVRNLIRGRKVFQIAPIIESSAHLGMQTIEKSVQSLIDEGKVSEETAAEWVSDTQLSERSVHARRKR